MQQVDRHRIYPPPVRTYKIKKFDEQDVARNVVEYVVTMRFA